jgi:hypothetical protein
MHCKVGLSRKKYLILPIARTHFDSPFEFEPAKLSCNCFFTGVGVAEGTLYAVGGHDGPLVKIL